MYTMHPHHVVQIYLGSIHTYIHMYLCVTDIQLSTLYCYKHQKRSCYIYKAEKLSNCRSVFLSFQLPSFVVYSAIDGRTYKPASCLNSSVDNMPTTNRHLLMYSFLTTLNLKNWAWCSTSSLWHSQVKTECFLQGPIMF